MSYVAAALFAMAILGQAATFQETAPGLTALAECRDRTTLHAGLDAFRERTKGVAAVKCDYREERGARILECSLPTPIKVFGGAAQRIEFSEAQGNKRVVSQVSGAPKNFLAVIDATLRWAPDAAKFPPAFAVNRSVDGSRDFSIGISPPDVEPRQVTCALSAGAAPIHIPAPAKPGSISGKLSYPSEFVPPMRVCAISVDGGNHFGCVTTSENQRTYRILNLHQATYYVVAYVKEAGVKATGAFTRAVRCGAGQPRCTDGSLIPVTLGEGNSITGIDPGDFYTSSDTWPKEPAQDHD